MFTIHPENKITASRSILYEQTLIHKTKEKLESIKKNK